MAVLIQEDIGGLEVAVQHALAVCVNQSDRHGAEYLDRLGDQQGAFADAVGQRAPLEILHDVVRRVGAPADAEQLDHVAIGEQEGELFDLTGQERPIETAPVGVELDRHATAGVAIDGHPDLAVRAHAEEPLGLVPRHVQRRPFPKEADLL